jgi:hypothetical protein
MRTHSHVRTDVTIVRADGEKNLILKCYFILFLNLNFIFSASVRMQSRVCADAPTRPYGHSDLSPR